SAWSGRNVNDVVNGGKNGDTLDGGSGADTLTGGPGADQMKFSGLYAGFADEVTDFESAKGDTIAFTQGAFGGLPVGQIALNSFIANAAGDATASAQRFLFSTGTSVL